MGHALGMMHSHAFGHSQGFITNVRWNGVGKAVLTPDLTGVSVRVWLLEEVRQHMLVGGR